MYCRGHAFSLVELSIVLVILGLLVGGILAGQSLVRASQLRGVAQDVNDLKTAIFTFRDKYFFLPGDIPNAEQIFSCTDCNGNGDGRIAGALIDDPIATNRYESSVALQHMAAAGLVSGTYTGMFVDTASRRILATDNAYQSKLSGALITLSRADLWNHMSPLAGRQALCLGHPGRSIMCNGPQWTTGRYRLYGEDGWNIDTKIDDGSARTGNMLADSCNAHVNSSNGFDDIVIYRSTNANLEYDLTNKAYSCGLMFLL